MVRADATQLYHLLRNLISNDIEFCKVDDNLKRIPVVILTTSRAEEDILKMYNLYANCHPPIDLIQFLEVVRSIQNFWLRIVTLPTR